MTGEDEPLTLEQEASEAFVQRLHGEWLDADQAALAARLGRDPAYARAYKRVAESWAALDSYATTPELMVLREASIAHARRANARRWLKPRSYLRSRWFAAAAAIVVTLSSVVAWQLSPYGYTPGQYRTGIGEQRVIELEDHTRVTLDANTLIKVRFSDDARTVRLEGQAQFSVVKDPDRPFKVMVGDRAIIVLGTVFTAEYFDREIRVAMLEGRVAVVAQRGDATLKAANDQPPDSPIELSAGEALRVDPKGEATITPKADIEVATAWRAGRVIFRKETLREAVRRLNRYSHLQIQIADDALAAKHINGVFDEGDTRGFLNTIEQYLPVTAEYRDSNTVRLKSK